MWIGDYSKKLSYEHLNICIIKVLWNTPQRYVSNSSASLFNSDHNILNHKEKGTSDKRSPSIRDWNDDDGEPSSGRCLMDVNWHKLKSYDQKLQLFLFRRFLSLLYDLHFSVWSNWKEFKFSNYTCWSWSVTQISFLVTSFRGMQFFRWISVNMLIYAITSYYEQPLK